MLEDRLLWGKACPWRTLTWTRMVRRVRSPQTEPLMQGPTRGWEGPLSLSPDYCPLARGQDTLVGAI